MTRDPLFNELMSEGNFKSKTTTIKRFYRSLDSKFRLHTRCVRALISSRCAHTSRPQSSEWRAMSGMSAITVVLYGCRQFCSCESLQIQREFDSLRKLFSPL